MRERERERERERVRVREREREREASQINLFSLIVLQRHVGTRNYCPASEQIRRPARDQNKNRHPTFSAATVAVEEDEEEEEEEVEEDKEDKVAVLLDSHSRPQTHLRKKFPLFPLQGKPKMNEKVDHQLR